MYYFRVNGMAAVPMISISMNVDKHNYTTRLIRSIDYPVEHLFIQIGNSEYDIVKTIVDRIESDGVNKYISKVSISTLDFNPGAAKGFNFGLRHLSQSNHSWILIVNSDIAFYPGTLKRITKNVNFELHNDTKFGIGFTNLCCGGEWSAVAFTHRLVNEVGYFDENFYPAYYEDDDYAMRVHYSTFQAKRFEDTHLIHGHHNGSEEYHSGIKNELYERPQSTASVRLWKEAFELGCVKSRVYFESKWGLNLTRSGNKPIMNCKTVLAMNSLCHSPFTVPFNNTLYNLSYWMMTKEVETRIRKHMRKNTSSIDF